MARERVGSAYRVFKFIYQRSYRHFNTLKDDNHMTIQISIPHRTGKQLEYLKQLVEAVEHGKSLGVPVVLATKHKLIKLC